MIKVKLTCPNWPIERQTPGLKGIWGNCHFYCNTSLDRCDYWVVYEGLEGKSEKTICPRENTILIACEPPSIKTYKKEFLDQFATIITCHHEITHHNPIIHQLGLFWHVGWRQKNHISSEFTKDYDELVSLTHFKKDKLLSVVVSSKDNTPGHRDRLNLITNLKEHFGEDIDIFGRGINEIEDKWDALSRYKYHIALENSSFNHYWTEKLADAFLAGCHPIYYGCPNIGQYFSQQSLTPIDINNPKETISIIENCIDQSTYEKTKPLIELEREKILNKYNLFPMICDHINKVHGQTTKYIPEMIKIKKEPSESNVFNQLKRKAKMLSNFFKKTPA